MAAELWDTGRVLHYLLDCSGNRDAPELRTTRKVARLLANDDDPRQRPSAEEALDLLDAEATVDSILARVRPVPQI